MTTTYYIYKENVNTGDKTLIKTLTTEHQAISTVQYLEEKNNDTEIMFFHTYKSRA